MSSIKCPQCGLVNFSTALQCKRCQTQMNQFPTVVERRPFQTSVQEVQSNPTQALYQNQQPAQYQNQQPVSYQNHQAAAYQPYQVPPPPNYYNDYGYAQQPVYQQPVMPMSCVKCGDNYNISLKNFKKDYVPPLAYLGIFAGIIPFIIIVAVLRVTHYINAPFCNECWEKFRKVSLFENLSAVGFFVGFIVAVVAGVSLDSGLAFLFFFSLISSFVIWAQIYKRKNSPKFTMVDRKQVVIDSPAAGEIRFANN